MKVAFDIAGTAKVMETASLEVVRLVASTLGLGVVDVEPFPGRVEVRVPGTTGHGKTEELAAQDFLRRVLA
jgi:hypothetical protein